MELAKTLKSKFPDVVVETFDNRGDQYAVVKKDGMRNIASSLRNDPEFRFDMLMDLSAVDYLFWEEKADRYEIIYNLYSYEKKHRLFVKALVPGSEPEIDSVASVWPAADWFEREVWDMFGIRFKDHPNLKRILMYDGFEGHPLKKDYPYTKRQPIIGPMN